MTTIFKKTAPYQHLQSIPRIIKAIVNNAIINPEVQKYDTTRPAPNATAIKPNVPQPLFLRIKNTAFDSLTPLYAKEFGR